MFTDLQLLAVIGAVFLVVGAMAIISLGIGCFMLSVKVDQLQKQMSGHH